MGFSFLAQGYHASPPSLLIHSSLIPHRLCRGGVIIAIPESKLFAGSVQVHVEERGVYHVDLRLVLRQPIQIDGPDFLPTNRASTNSCLLIYIVFLPTRAIRVNEKFVYVGNQKVTFIIAIDLTLILAATFDSD